jgi:hypothetical protein
MQGKAVEMTSKNASKWRKYNFKGKTHGMKLISVLDAYCIDSSVRGVAYLADNEEFAIIRGEGFLVCKIPEMPQLAKELRPVFRDEVLGIYKDLQDLKLMEVRYA